jgi:PE family
VSYVDAAPQSVIAVAGDLAGIGSAIKAANAAAASPTTAVVAPAADFVSAQIATLFSGHAHVYQSLSTQAEAFHQSFVRAFTASAGSCVHAGGVNASPLKTPMQGLVGPAEDVPGYKPLGPSLIRGRGCLGGRGSRVFSGASPARLVTPLDHGLKDGLDMIGAPANVIEALERSSSIFVRALEDGNLIGALTALAEAPANIAFRYGETIIDRTRGKLRGPTDSCLDSTRERWASCRNRLCGSWHSGERMFGRCLERAAVSDDSGWVLHRLAREIGAVTLPTINDMALDTGRLLW